jgi:hypothetical protein
MSRTAHFLVGLGILALCVAWSIFCVFCFFSNAFGHDSLPGANIFEPSFLIIYLTGVIGLLCGLVLAFRCFYRAFKSPQQKLLVKTSPPQQKTDFQTPNDRLSSLVKKKMKP